MKEAILYHAEKYPHMMPSDAIKIVYQSVFGPAHMIYDKDAAFQYLVKEYNSCKQIIAPLCDPLGGGLVRVNLNALDASGVSLQNVFDAFVATANEVKGTVEEFERQLELLCELAKEGVFGFTYEELENYLCEYRKAGYPLIHHSEEYKKIYHPSYRVVMKELLSQIINSG